MPVRVNPKPSPEPAAVALAAVADSLRQTVEAVAEHNRAILDAVHQATAQNFRPDTPKRVTATISERDPDGRVKAIEMIVIPFSHPQD